MAKREDLSVKTDDQLATELGQLKREQFNLRFQAATNQLEKPSRVREVRRSIAQSTTPPGGRRAGAAAARPVQPAPPGGDQPAGEAVARARGAPQHRPDQDPAGGARALRSG